jgi:hypothetical protein
VVDCGVCVVVAPLGAGCAIRDGMNRVGESWCHHGSESELAMEKLANAARLTEMLRKQTRADKQASVRRTGSGW